MYDVAIIGAGIIGKAIARELSKYKLDLILIEKDSDVANGTTKANSAIVHAGFDPEPGTLKAKLNAEGNRLFRDLCLELDVPFHRNGSLVIAFCKEEMQTLQKLYERGLSYGIPGLKVIDREELHKKEPGLNDEAVGALYAATAGITDPYLLAIALEIPYSRVRKLLAHIRKENDFRFKSFGDMSADEVAEMTGLNMESAELAKQREYDETVKLDLSGEDVSKFLEKIGEVGLNWAYGGRLYHVMGGGNKGKAVEVLSGLYRKLWGKIETVGLGDSLNDSPMLSQVDIPILVQKRDCSWEDIDLPRLRKVQGIGPEGWSRAIAPILSGFGG